jgi:hypothetical protein
MLALSRANVYGPADPLIQMATGIRYERDITGLFTGPHLGYFANATQAMMQPLFGRNSPDTNTAEWNAAKGFYQAVGSPLIAMGLTGMQMGPAVNAFGGMLTQGFTSNVAADKFADLVVGEKDSRKKQREREEKRLFEPRQKDQDTRFRDPFK